MGYNIAFQIAALGVVVYIFSLMLFMKRLPTKNNRLYFFLVAASVLSLALDIASIMLITLEKGAGSVLCHIIDKLYFASLIIINYNIFRYVCYSLKGTQDAPLRTKLFMLAPMAAGLAGVAFFNSRFVYSDGAAYTDGPIVYVTAAVCAVYVVASVITLAVLHKNISSYALFAFIAVMVLEIAAAAIQFFFPYLFLISYGIMLICLFLFFTLENPKLSVESDSGLYNRHGFLQVVRTLLEEKRNFSIIAVNFEDYERISSTSGVKYADHYVEQIAHGISKIRSSILFLTKEHQLCIVYRGDEKKAVENAYNISFYLNRPQTVCDFEFIPDCRISVSRYPENGTTVDAVLENIDYSLTSAKKNKRNSVVIFNKELADSQRRLVQIKAMLREALENDGFTVFYQPIYNAEGAVPVSAEALVRLKSDKLGYVSPEEFIPIAESSGLILQLGMRVFELTCSFIHTNRLYDSCLEFMEINLSGVQCMQHDLADRLYMVMKKYDIPTGFINLEITETAAMESSDALNANMERMIEYGSTFSLDDFGSGYSNVQYIINFPFSAIKLDKQMVWTYFDKNNTKAKTVMEANIAMMKKLNLKIIAEGVETEAQMLRLREIGVDYLQGFYFSKPVRGEEFLALLPDRAAKQAK